MRSIDLGMHRAIAEGSLGEDKSHPESGGLPGYRLVYKTIGLIPSEILNLVADGFRIQFSLRSMQRGGLTVERSLPAREPNVLILPEYVESNPNSNGTSKVTPRPDLEMKINGSHEDFGQAGYVEFLMVTEAEDPADIINEGRRKLARFKVMFDLLVGRRLLGTPITEEVGRIFKDWHWVQRTASAWVIFESLERAIGVNCRELRDKINSANSQYSATTEVERRRIRLASEWYWKADHEPDPRNQYVQLWFSIEALEMPNSTKIPVVMRRLAALTGTELSLWKVPVGKLYTARCELAHGEVETVALPMLRTLKIMCLLLLEARIAPTSMSELKTELLRLMENTSEWLP